MRYNNWKWFNGDKFVIAFILLSMVVIIILTKCGVSLCR
jgi:hypothetical protein